MTARTGFPTLSPHTSGSDFARLSKKIADAGLMARRPGYYATRITVVAALYAGDWTAFAMIGANLSRPFILVVCGAGCDGPAAAASMET